MKGMTVDLAGKTALVTGGGGVLCGHMAKALAESGAKVVVADLKKEAAESIVAEIEGSGGTAMAVACNVLEKESLEAALSEVQSAFGSIDILVNGAGGNHPKGTTSKEYLQKEDLTNVEDGFKSFFDLDPAGIEFVFNLNFLGTLLPTQVFSKGMVEKGGGVVINISSMNAFCPLTKIPAYSAAKAAVSNFTQWLAVHFSKVGVRVNAIAPGFFVTAQNKALLMNDDGSLTPRGEAIVNNTPMGRFGDPKELLGTLLWLVSDDASGFVSGTVIPVDGAFAAFSGV